MTINETAQKYIDKIREKCQEIKPLVVIRSITFNHENYLRDALESFVMQKTDFPFVAIVHDDASTDGTAEVLREYAEKYPDIILPILEKDNQWSKHDGSLSQILKEAVEATGAKYIALCEGDDYWTDPLKLQKQVDFLEQNPDFSLCATNVINLLPDGTKIEPIFNVKNSRVSPIKEVILRGGAFLSTCTLVFKSSDFFSMPVEAKKLHVGDYPLQIYLTHIGKTMIINALTSVYRLQSAGSWTQRNIENFSNRSVINKNIQNEKNLFETMDRVTGMKYHKYFRKRENLTLYQAYRFDNSFSNLKYILKSPSYFIKECGWKNIMYSLTPKFIRNRK